MSSDSESPTKIRGSKPGVLDATQAARVLRHPTSNLSFAAFDPRTASCHENVPDFRKLSLNEELYRPKRIVMETTSTGESFWRFVPKARLDEGVLDEGEWPRVIEICGEEIDCSQDQWDIYKLDPEYECLVCVPPGLTRISHVKTNQTRDLNLETPTSKRRMSISSADNTPLPNIKKKIFGRTLELSSDEEEDEVVEMIVDSEARRERPGKRAKRFRADVEKNRHERREKLARREEKLGRQEEGLQFGFSGHAPSGSLGKGPPKRKVSALYDSFRSQRDQVSPEEELPLRSKIYSRRPENKRTRTVSPPSAHRELDAKRQERAKQKAARVEQEFNERKQKRHEQFMREVYTEASQQETPPGGVFDPVQIHSSSVHDKSAEGDDKDTKEEKVGQEEKEIVETEDEDEDAARQAAIAESRRKLNELEADRPIWEEAAKSRALSEKLEEEDRRARTEERRRAEGRRAEIERQEKAQREELRLREEALRREREDAARRERERCHRQQRYSVGPWTPQRALERYRSLSDTFDTTKFSPDNALTFEVIPWPVLHSPISFTVEDVDWTAVERFFESVKPHMRTQDFKALVEKSHRRFHPDRWRSRNLLKSVADDSERACLEVAANTVAQALTPLWRDLTGR